MAGSTKVMKKKKKSVYTSMGLGLNKEGMLGNLLEESYQDCVENEQSNKWVDDVNIFDFTLTIYKSSRNDMKLRIWQMNCNK